MATKLVDALGNELVEGNLVILKLGAENIIGTVLEIKQGGIDLAVREHNKPQQTPGTIVIGFQMPILFQPDPHMRIGSLYRVIDPRVQSEVEKFNDKYNSRSVPTIVP